MRWFDFRRALARNLLASVALLGVIVLASGIGGYILSKQRVSAPGWVPVIGQEQFELRAELETAQGVLPGQGQAVNVSGIRVGDITGVHVDDGKAIVTFQIKERFAQVYPDATVLLRPKTGLKDMVLELDPGSPKSGPKLEDGDKIEIDQTLADVNFSDFLETLDADTRDYLRLLVGDGGRALGQGGGRDLANVLRRFHPLARDVRRASRLVARRRAKLRRVMSNFSRLMSELGRHDDELARFVSGSNAVFRRFANQNENLAETIELLPPALRSGNRALARMDRLGRTLEAAFTDLRPLASSLGPTMRRLRPFFRRTVGPIRDQIRPFTREVQPVARELSPAARRLAGATPDLARFWRALNALFDEMAYNPPGDGKGGEGYLFYVPWAVHNTNSTLAAQDGIGPVRRGMVLLSCGSLQFLEALSSSNPNPTLTTLIQLLNAPSREGNCT